MLVVCRKEHELLLVINTHIHPLISPQHSFNYEDLFYTHACEKINRFWLLLSKHYVEIVVLFFFSLLTRPD